MTNGLIATLIAGSRSPRRRDSGSSIEIGHHVQREFAGMTFNLDTIWLDRRRRRDRRCSGLLACAELTKTPRPRPDQDPADLGERRRRGQHARSRTTSARCNPFVIPLAIALFFFILIANWLELIPTELNEDVPHLLSAPTADTNLTYAMAAIVIVGVWTYGIRPKGVKGYFKHFLEPYPVPAAAEHPRGAGQADHAGPATLRQHLRRRHHARR